MDIWKESTELQWTVIPGRITVREGRWERTRTTRLPEGGLVESVGALAEIEIRLPRLYSGG